MKKFDEARDPTRVALLKEDAARAISENTALYDRIVAHDPADRSCEYLFTPK